MNGGISSDAWNALVRDLWRKLHPNVTVLDNGAWRHPWNVQPQWNGTSWTADIQPGFVYGYEPVVKMPTGNVPITQQPAWPLSGFRSIGPGAAPTGYTTSPDGSSATESFEPVPPFFQVRGVGPAPKANATQDGGFVLQDNAPANSRLLRACDLVLNQPRMKTVSSIDVGNGTDSTIVQASVGYQAPADPTPYITQTARYSPPAPADPLQQLMGIWADSGIDQLLLSTVYFLSQPGASRSDLIDGSWAPFVKHQVFWNLGHATQAFIRSINSDNLTLNTGLAGGVGDSLNQFLLSQVNDANSAIAQFLGNNSMEGRFWTV